MSWLNTITSVFISGNDRLGDSIVKVNAVVDASLTAGQKQALRDKAKAAAAQIEAILIDLVDDIPFVPRSFAKIGVNLLVNALEAAIATALEGVKAKA
jgi:hypothetical protein